jgi:hypothetical protein
MTYDGQCEAETSDDRAKQYTTQAAFLEKAKSLSTLSLEGS